MDPMAATSRGSLAVKGRLVNQMKKTETNVTASMTVAPNEEVPAPMDQHLSVTIPLDSGSKRFIHR